MPLSLYFQSSVILFFEVLMLGLNLRESHVVEVLSLISDGAKVRFVQDYYGGEWVELTTGWILKTTTRHKLHPEDVRTVRSAVRARGKIAA